MTPDKLSEVEFRARNARDFPTVNDAKDDVMDVCAALRTAWAERDNSVRVIRDASYRLKTPFMGGEHIRNARDVLEDFTRTLTRGPLPEDFDFRMEQRCVELAAERDARPDAATVEKAKTVIGKLHDFCAVYSVGGNDLLVEAREALRLLERKP